MSNSDFPTDGFDADGFDPDGHDTPAHGPLPLADVDPADLHQAVDALAATLHEYVDSAAGVRAEFGAHEADEDPRILEIESRVATLNAELYDLIHERLGLHSSLTGLAWDWDDEDGSGPSEDESADEPDSFHLGFMVWPPDGASDESMDSVFGMIEQGGEATVQRLVDAGFHISEWGTSRSTPVLFDDSADDE